MIMVIMKITLFRDVLPCILLDMKWHVEKHYASTLE